VRVTHSERSRARDSAAGDQVQAQTGWNTFTNVRGLQDEMLRARVSSSEFHLGARYAF